MEEDDTKDVDGSADVTDEKCSTRSIEDLMRERLAEVPSGFFNKLDTSHHHRTSSTLLRDLSPCVLDAWCSAVDRHRPEEWNEARCSSELRALPIYSLRHSILDAISNADVTILLSPCGTGKSLIAPALLAEMVRGDTDSERRGHSRRGLSICPSAEHGSNTAKRAEKLYMQTLGALCDIANFTNPFEQSPVALEAEYYAKDECLPSTEGAAKHAVTTYKGGMIALDGKAHPNLKLLHIDEIHSTMPELLIILQLACRQLQLKNVHKILLTSATLDGTEIDLLARYFKKANLTLRVVDLSREIRSSSHLTMSCAKLEFGPRQKGDLFEHTKLSATLTYDFSHRIFHRPNKNEEQLLWFGCEEDATVPEMNQILPFVKQGLDRGMQIASEMMEKNWKGDGEDTMPSLLLILPGKEHIDRVASAIEGTYLVSDAERASAGFEHFLYEGEPAFLIVKMKSKAMKATMKRGVSEGEENEPSDAMKYLALSNANTIKGQGSEEKKLMQKLKELRDPRGSWGGWKGEIILATPQMVDGMTCDNVTTVVDPGVMRIPGPYSPDGLRSLELIWIDRRLLYQRAGRCGRTCDGEYFVCASAKKVDKILKDDIKSELLIRNFDVLSWIRAKEMGVFDDLIWTPPSSLINQFKDSCIIKGLWKQNRFTSDTSKLFSYFNFITPDLARFVVMGVRLGLAAHVICYVAEMTAAHKPCGRPTKIRENYEAISDSAAYDAYVNVLALSQFNDDDIRSYDMGDSVTKADMVVTLFRHIFPPIETREHPPSKSTLPTLNVELEPNYDGYWAYDAAKWKVLEELATRAPDGYFWSGRWCPGKDEKRDDTIGMIKLQQVFIRDEGREAVAMNVSQLTRALQRLGLIYPPDGVEGRGSIFSPRFNRYLRARDNYNLSDDGRALFRALLCMSSDKVASAFTTETSAKTSFDIDISNGSPIHRWESIYPERKDWKARNKKSTVGLVRFWDAFQATHSFKYTGCLDPISATQAAFFLNVFGKVEKTHQTIAIHLNASPKKCQDGIKRFHVNPRDSGISIKLKEEVSLRVFKWRRFLIQSANRLCTEREGKFDEVAKSIILLWEALDDGTEKTIKQTKEWKEKNEKLDLYWISRFDWAQSREKYDNLHPLRF